MCSSWTQSNLKEALEHISDEIKKKSRLDFESSLVFQILGRFRSCGSENRRENQSEKPNIRLSYALGLYRKNARFRTERVACSGKTADVATLPTFTLTTDDHISGSRVLTVVFEQNEIKQQIHADSGSLTNHLRTACIGTPSAL